MLENLKKHWKVNGLNLALIITTFALGGSLCGYTGRKLLLLTNIDKGVFWFVLYILLITLLWPVCVILISIPLGQYGFFKKYVVRVWHKITGSHAKHPAVRIAIFASGAGSNAQKIIDHFAGSDSVNISLIVCNNPAAGVLNIAEKEDIPPLLIGKEQFFSGDHYLPMLKQHQIDFIALAGFLWKLPGELISAYPKKIVNIHPALLPKYGGKGMYGHFVHEAVIASGDKESGITIHYVDELFDHGEIIFQAKCSVESNDDAGTLAQKIHVLEHAHYAAVIEKILYEELNIGRQNH